MDRDTDGVREEGLLGPEELRFYLSVTGGHRRGVNRAMVETS